MFGLALLCATACSSAPTAAEPLLAQTSAPMADPTLAPASVPTEVPAVAPTPTPEPDQAQSTSAAPATADQPAGQAASEEVTSQPTSEAVTAQSANQPVAEPTADAASQLASCDPNAVPASPLPAPGSAAAQGFFRSFRVPLPPAPLYDPPGPKRVGLQAGHWLVEQVPPELHGLQAGAVGGGKQEWQVNLDLTQRTASLLEAAGVQVDVLPATVPEHYQANAFVAIHADGDTSGATRGFKVARPGFSSIPDIDDRLVDSINSVYGSETELPRDDEHISLRMRYYYAFNSRRYCHAVMPGVPQAIIETGYLTNAADRQYLIGDPQKLALALADSIQAFLATTP